MVITLVTGAPGWLGTRLVHVLVEGLPGVPDLAEPDYASQIRCLVQRGRDASELQRLSRFVDLVEGDLRDSESVQKFCEGAEGATLFHCAGVIHPAHGVQEFFDVNLEGTRKLLQAAENADVRRVIVVSSNSPIGTNPFWDHLFNEDSPYNPYMGYGRSKMLMEKVVHEYQIRGKLETVIVRPPWFYGPHQPTRQTSFFRMIRMGTFPVVGDGENRRSMAYIDNICQGLLLCEQKQAANGETYWIADARPYTMNEIINTVKQLMKAEFGIPVARRQVRLPEMVGDIATFIDRLLQRGGIYKQKVHVLSEMNKTIACSIEKARDELNYNPKIELEEGMRRSLHWCKKQGIKI